MWLLIIYASIILIEESNYFPLALHFMITWYNRSLLFLPKATSPFTNSETYFLENRENGGGNNRGNRSSTRFTFPGFHRIQPGREKIGADQNHRPVLSEVSRGNKNGNRSLISATAEPTPAPSSSPLSPQVFSNTEGRSLVWMHHESETGCKYKTKAGSAAASTPRLVSRDVLALGMAPSLDFPMPCINWYAKRGGGTVKPRFPF